MYQVQLAKRNPNLLALVEIDIEEILGEHKAPDDLDLEKNKIETMDTRPSAYMPASKNSDKGTSAYI